jgi:tetratricopeptide (TPR) repeat protein
VLVASVVLGLVGSSVGCRHGLPPEEEVAPEVAEATHRQDALSVYEELEALIAHERDSEQDRAFAYERVREMPDDQSPEYAFARAALAGRLAELRGLKAIRLVGEVERWARESVRRDPEWNDAAATRMLGTLYVKAPARYLDHGDSEDGLELLEELAEARPDDPINHLRLAEAYVHLGDRDPAAEPLCKVLPVRDQLRPDEQQLLDGLVRELGGVESLACDSDGEA